MARRSDPNRMLSAAIYGTARKLAVDGGCIAEAKQIIQDLADGRYDLVGVEAGRAVGCWSVTVQRRDPVYLAGCRSADRLGARSTWTRWARALELGRERASSPMNRAG